MVWQFLWCMELKVAGDILRLSYIYHDCFVLETPSAFFVFDFWKEPGTGAGDMPSFISRISSVDKKVYVLVSHHHKDHFVKDVFLWKNVICDIHYIISRDVFRSVKYALRDGSVYKGPGLSPSDYTVLNPGEDFECGDVVVSAFGSTDIGNSYVVSSGDRHFFHAGDLNAWVWKDESTVEEIRMAIQDFEDIVKSIAKRYPVMDLAMFPVDSRIGRDYWEGACRFVRLINVRYFVPMHFELADDDSEREKRCSDAFDFESYANKSRGEYIGLSAEGDSFEFY